MNTIVLAMIIAAISIAIVAEVLVAYEKRSLRKAMQAELDSAEENPKSGQRTSLLVGK